MYHYPSEERALLQRRVDQFRGQVNRFLDGKLDEDELFSALLMGLCR